MFMLQFSKYIRFAVETVIRRVWKSARVLLPDLLVETFIFDPGTSSVGSLLTISSEVL